MRRLAWGRRRRGHLSESRGQAAGIVGAFAGLPSGRRIEGSGGALHGFNVFRVGRRLFFAGRIKHWA